MTEQRSRALVSLRAKVLFLVLLLLSLVMIRNFLMVQDLSFIHVLQGLSNLILSERGLKSGGLLMFGIVALMVCGLMCCVVNDE